MTLTSGLIRFHVNQTGRTHTGAARNFDCPALCALINSPAVQERVRLRGMHGYFGHWPRLRYGLYPPEGALDGGKLVHLEPALVTIRIKAEPDGIIEHEAEFLDTPPGQIAARLHSNRIGGFSSAILAPQKRDGFDIASEFAGFDYVAEQNVVQNRGYLLDSVQAAQAQTTAIGAGLIMDAMEHEYQGSLSALHTLLRHMQRDYELQAQVILALQQENEDLLSMQMAAPKLDSVRSQAHQPGARPGSASMDATHQFTASAQAFMHARLPAWQPSAAAASEQNQAYAMIKERVYGSGQ